MLCCTGICYLVLLNIGNIPGIPGIELELLPVAVVSTWYSMVWYQVQEFKIAGLKTWLQV